MHRSFGPLGVQSRGTRYNMGMRDTEFRQFDPCLTLTFNPFSMQPMISACCLLATLGNWLQIIR